MLNLSVKLTSGKADMPVGFNVVTEWLRSCSKPILPFIERFFEEEGEVTNSKNISYNYGTNNLPEDWNNFFNVEEFNNREKVLTTSKTTENFNVTEKLSIKSDLNINKFGLLILSTDEMGYGIDHGDYVVGFTYFDEVVYFEFPGGVGNVDTPSFD